MKTDIYNYKHVMFKSRGYSLVDMATVLQSGSWFVVVSECATEESTWNIEFSSRILDVFHVDSSSSNDGDFGFVCGDSGESGGSNSGRDSGIWQTIGDWDAPAGDDGDSAGSVVEFESTASS